jgi:hypothetical protein
VTGRHLESTQADASRCARCELWILTAWDDGLLVRCYAQPLDPAHEPAVLAARLDTYTRTRSGWLIHRDAYRRSAPLDPTHTIHAQHRCNGGNR